MFHHIPSCRVDTSSAIAHNPSLLYDIGWEWGFFSRYMPIYMVHTEQLCSRSDISFRNPRKDGDVILGREPGMPNDFPSTSNTFPYKLHTVQPIYWPQTNNFECLPNNYHGSNDAPCPTNIRTPEVQVQSPELNSRPCGRQTIVVRAGMPPLLAKAVSGGPSGGKYVECVRGVYWFIPPSVSGKGPGVLWGGGHLPGEGNWREADFGVSAACSIVWRISKVNEQQGTGGGYCVNSGEKITQKVKVVQLTWRGVLNRNENGGVVGGSLGVGVI